jgi:hypothetical protein
MKILKPLPVVLLLAGVAAQALAGAPQDLYYDGLQCRSVHAAEQSFADLYRQTISDTGLGSFGALPAPRPPEGAVRVAALPAPAPSQFSIGVTPEPRLWLLLSGLAAALWVARRRLDASF